MNEESIIGNYLYKCLTEEQREILKKAVQKMDMNTPPLMFSHNENKDALEIKIELVFGSHG